MKTRIILFSILIFTSYTTYGQYAEGCDGKRYAADVWTSVNKSTVKYASTIPENQDLFIDIYQPIGDVLSKRPLILLAHGGAFIGGDKADMQVYCEAYAKKGFVTASVQYRLMTGWPSKESFYNALIEAVSDMKAAYRFFKSDAANANLYRVDTTKIFIGGYSAGAITALHTAYLDEGDYIDSLASRLLIKNGGINGNTGDAENRSHSTKDIFGVLNFSGALAKSGLLDSGEPMLMSYHGDMDNVVPIDSSVFLGLVPLVGSRPLAVEATAKGIPNVLEVVPGGDHTNIYSDLKFLPNLLNFYYEATDLYYPRLCGFKADIRHTSLPIAVTNLWPNPSRDIIHIDFNTHISSVIIYNSDGKFISKQAVDNTSKVIDISGLVSGSYYLLPVDKATFYKGIAFTKI
jgi:acetyl esterase/lipase